MGTPWVGGGGLVGRGWHLTPLCLTLFMLVMGEPLPQKMRNLGTIFGNPSPYLFLFPTSSTLKCLASDSLQGFRVDQGFEMVL